MKRLKSLNIQFKSAFSPKMKPLDELFINNWVYLGMDEFLSEEGKEMRDRVLEFGERAEVNHLHENMYTTSASFPHQLIPEIA